MKTDPTEAASGGYVHPGHNMMKLNASLILLTKFSPKILLIFGKCFVLMSLEFTLLTKVQKKSIDDHSLQKRWKGRHVVT